MFYNSFLPEIATEDQMDKLSAKGFSLGYVGSVILLVLNLVLIMMPDKLGITTGMATRISFLSVGIWWAGWAQIPFRALPKYSHKRLGNPEDHLFQAGFKELYKTWKEAMMNMQMKRFLPAFFFFNMGIQTIMLVAPLFGEKLLKIPSSGLIATILLLQVLAILGAFLTSRLSGKMGNKITLILLLMCWVTICICAYFTETHNEFYALAGGVGLIMGGSQSLSRSTFAKYIPEDSPDTASYFSFYDVTEKASVVIGTFSYGIVEQLTGTMRNSVLALIVFFVFGLAIISTLKSKAKKEATFQ
jgi:UMF1 family MFS transporter